MPRRVTLTFEDGGQAVYEGVPDAVTPEQVVARAARDFSDRKLTAIDGGRGPKPQEPQLFQPSEVGMGEALARAAVAAPYAASRAVAMPAYGAATLAEQVVNLFRDEPSSGLSDLVARTFLDPATRTIEAGAPKPSEAFTGPAEAVYKGVTGLGDVIGQLALGGGPAGASRQAVAALPAVAARGGASTAPTITSEVMRAFTPEALAVAPMAARAGSERTGALSGAGVSPEVAVLGGLLDALNAEIGGILPLSAGSSLPTGAARAISRGAQGAGSGVVTAEAQRGAQNLLMEATGQDPRLQAPFSGVEAGAQAIPATVLAMLFGGRVPPRGAPDRAGLGYTPPDPGAEAAAGLAADFERFRPILEANGITDPAHPGAPLAIGALRVREARQAEAAAQAAEAAGARYQEPPPAGRQPAEVIYAPPPVDLDPTTGGTAARPAINPADRGPIIGKLATEGALTAERVQAGRDFAVAGKQRERKVEALDEANLRGEQRDLRDVSAAGTADAAGTAATAPESFTFFRPVVRNGQMVSGERVEPMGEPFTVKSGKKQVLMQSVRFVDREGQPEMPVPAKELKDFARPAAPRFAQDIASRTVEPRRGVGEETLSRTETGAPRRAAQRVGARSQYGDYIPAEPEAPAPEPGGREGRDVTDLAFERVGQARPEALPPPGGDRLPAPPAGPRRLEGPASRAGERTLPPEARNMAVKVKITDAETGRVREVELGAERAIGVLDEQITNLKALLDCLRSP